MSKVVGFVLVAAGVGLASSMLLFGPDAEQGTYANSDTPTATGVSGDAVRAVRSGTEEQKAAVARPGAAPRVERADSPILPPAPVVVTILHRNEQPSTQKATRVPSDRASLARELQQELKRVGCYHGEVHGIWTPATRKAMKAFTDRVNASLPTEEPDYILLSLVQAHAGESCDKPCPQGHGLSEDGRCLPTAVLAHASRKAPSPEDPNKRAPAIAAWTTTTSPAAPPARPAEPPPGRMALAGPTAEPPPASAAPGTQPQVKQDRQAQRASPPDRRAFARQSYQPRSRFVESVLRSRNSLN